MLRPGRKPFPPASRLFPTLRDCGNAHPDPSHTAWDAFCTLNTTAPSSRSIKMLWMQFPASVNPRELNPAERRRTLCPSNGPHSTGRTRGRPAGSGAVWFGCSNTKTFSIAGATLVIFPVLKERRIIKISPLWKSQTPGSLSEHTDAHPLQHLEKI